MLAGLSGAEKRLPPVWFYDERGSLLFDEITRLPEYYPTRAEREILRRHAGEIVALADARTLVELGSGTSDKTRLLLDAMSDADRLERFVPLDVSEEVLTAAAGRDRHDLRLRRARGGRGLPPTPPLPPRGSRRTARCLPRVDDRQPQSGRAPPVLFDLDAVLTSDDHLPLAPTWSRTPTG